MWIQPFCILQVEKFNLQSWLTVLLACIRKGTWFQTNSLEPCASSRNCALANTIKDLDDLLHLISLDF